MIIGIFFTFVTALETLSGNVTVHRFAYIFIVQLAN